MPLKKMHKKDLKSKTKDKTGGTNQQSKLTTTKIKYNHKNHWLEEEDTYIPFKKKKKK